MIQLIVWYLLITGKCLSTKDGGNKIGEGSEGDIEEN